MLGSFSVEGAAADPVLQGKPGAAFSEDASQALIERVNASQNASYHSVLAQFDAYLAAHPRDGIAAVEKCRFLEHFADSEDQTIPSAADDWQACQQDLLKPEVSGQEAVRLYRAQKEWGAQGTEHGEALLLEPDTARWTDLHRAALHEHLYRIYSLGEDSTLKSGEHAWAAVRLNPASPLRLAASEYLVSIGARKPALALLHPADAFRWPDHELDRVAHLLIDLGDVAGARRTVERQSKDKLSAATRVTLARTLAQAGEVQAARALLADAQMPDSALSTSEQALRDRFQFELEYGDRKSSEAAYRALRARGWSADPLGRRRLSLFLKYPTVGVTSSDLLGPAAFIGCLIACVLLPLPLIAVIHYRGVVKQLGGWQPDLSVPWNLGHLWYALALVGVTEVVSGFAFPESGFEAILLGGVDLPHPAPTSPAPPDLGNAFLLATALLVAGTVPLLRHPAQRAALRGKWSIAKSVLVGIACCAPLLAVEHLIARLTHQAGSAAALGSETTKALQGIYSHYGVAALVVIACVAAPFAEELVFRGVFLRSTARYLAFWWAALLQAGVFAFLHEEPGAFAPIFVVGLVAAWLARRSEGLLTPMVLHATNNTIVVSGLVLATNAMNAAP